MPTDTTKRRRDASPESSLSIDATMAPALFEDFEQSTPLFVAPSRPGSTVKTAMKNVWVYLTEFDSTTERRTRLERFGLHGGKLCEPGTTNIVPLEVGSAVWFYFSHRDDLAWGAYADGFKADNSGIPLTGPVIIPGGVDPELFIDLWQQNDWCIVHNVPVGGRRASQVLMADWNDRYVNGYSGRTAKNNVPGFWNYLNHEKKDKQERWDRNRAPIPLAEFSTVDNSPVLIGTLTHLPADRCKLLLIHKKGGVRVVASSFNEIAHTGENLFLPSHHTYDIDMTTVLAAMTPQPENEEDLVIDAFPEPPRRCLLPGDACWQDQSPAKAPMYCGTYSFSTAMNYWLPYTYNPLGKDGKYLSDNDMVGGFRNGASTPRHLIEACTRQRMNGVDRSAEYLTRQRAIKLLKLWIQAGVPVVVLLNEKPNRKFIAAMSGGHYKTLVGYDGDRLFFNNTGMDFEVIKSRRDAGIDYESAPIGNDVDSEDMFWKKWKGYSKLADWFSDADKCTFIPIYPKRALFSSKKKT